MKWSYSHLESELCSLEENGLAAEIEHNGWDYTLRVFTTQQKSQRNLGFSIKYMYTYSGEKFDMMKTAELVLVGITEDTLVREVGSVWAGTNKIEEAGKDTLRETAKNMAAAQFDEYKNEMNGKITPDQNQYSFYSERKEVNNFFNILVCEEMDKLPFDMPWGF
jgi:hypothetical protein